VRGIAEELDEEDREERVDSAEEIDDDGKAGLRIFNISTTLTSKHSIFPRYGVTLGNRYAREVSNTLFVAGRVSVNPKWELGVRIEFDTMDSRLDRGELRIRRYFDRIVLDFSVERNEGVVRGDEDTAFRFRLGLRALVDDDNNAEDFDEDPTEDEDDDGGTLLGGLGLNKDPAPQTPTSSPKPLDPRNTGSK
jgi:hypothetical protein